MLIEHEEEREGDLEDKFIALWRSLWRGEEGGRRKRGEKSDRLDYESTHRRTLFNVSLTFLVSISSPLTCSCWRDRQEGEGEGWREGAQGGGGAPAVLQPRSRAPDKVEGQGSREGQPIRTGEDPVPLGDEAFFIRLPARPSFVFSLPTPAGFHPSVPSFMP